MATAALFLTMALAVLNSQALAQTCSATMDFSDSTSIRYYSSGTVAIKGFYTGNVFGRVKNGVLTDFDLRIDPDVNGPNGLRLITTAYNASPSVAAPTYRCIDTSYGAKVTITRVPTAREYFYLNGTYSIGYADVDIYFEKSGPGRIVVSYKHSALSRATTTPPTPVNGLIVNAVLQGGARLTITNR